MGARAVVAACVAALVFSASAHAAGVTKQALTIPVTVGPEKETCDVAAYLFTPAGADARHPAPAILATNGFGGSRDDFNDLGNSYAEHGYVFLAYSGLGFGGSGCKITLDDREHDGQAGSQLIDYLAKLDYVTKDKPGDPRVGMVGGSYGGQIQFAVAAIDKRLDTIIPQITWNDLSYSLGPNNTDFTAGVTYGTPGVVKLDWPVLFFGLGTGQGIAAAIADPSHVGTCPNFADEVCTALVQGAARGYLDADGVRLLRNASVSSYIKQITIPTFLMQGQSDNLFNLQESVVTYKSLKQQGVPVKLLWRSAGHSGGDIGDSEWSETNLDGPYESRMALAWFDHYLKGKPQSPNLDFSFLTDWIPYKGDAAPAVGTAPTYPAGTNRTFYLSGSDSLVDTQNAVTAAKTTIVESAAPTSQGGGVLSPDGNDPPGTSVSFTTQPLATDLDAVGIPSVTIRVDAPTFAAAVDPAAKLLLFAKLYDVAPDGTATLNRALISAARVGDVTKPVTIQLPGLVHRYPKGHSLRVTVSTSSVTYRGTLGAGPVSILTDPQSPSTLTVPVLGLQTGPVGSGPFGTTPFDKIAKPGAPVRRAAKLPKRRPCRTTPRRLRFPLRAHRRLAVARVFVNGKKVKTIRGKALDRRVVIRLKKAKKATVVVISQTLTGEKRVNGRRYRSC